MSENRGTRGRGPVIVAVAAAILLVLTVAVVWGWKNLGPDSVRTEHETDRYEGVTELALSNNDGDVTVVAGDTDAVVVERELVWSREKPGSDEQVSSGRLSIEQTGCAGWIVAQGWCHINYRIRVPADTVLDVSVDSGDLVTENIAGKQWLNADSGEITVTGASGAVDLNADSGDIVGDRLAGGTVSADADSGDIDLRFVEAPTAVTADADSGEVRLRVPDDGQSYRVAVQVDSGKEEVTVPTDAAAERIIEVQADSGDVEILTA